MDKKTRDARIDLRMPEKLYNDILNYAERNDMTMTAVVLKAIRGYIYNSTYVSDDAEIMLIKTAAKQLLDVVNRLG